MTDSVYRSLLLKQEWNLHHGPHRCYYNGGDGGTCPSEYDSLADFLESRGWTDFPVDSEKDEFPVGFSGQQDSGQDPVLTYHLVTCKDERVDYDAGHGLWRCRGCAGWFHEYPERPTIASGEPNDNEVDQSPTSISLVLEGLDSIDRNLAGIYERLDGLEHNGKADTALLVKLITNYALADSGIDPIDATNSQWMELVERNRHEE